MARIPDSRRQTFLTRAAAIAEKSAARLRGGPFGAVVTRNGKIVAEAANSVLAAHDATRHAEINAIQRASRKLKKLFLDDCEIFSTTEPCPMCFSAIHWARLKSVTYATTIADVRRLGFNELKISATRMKKLGESRVKINRLRNAACKDLLRLWKKIPGKKNY